MTVVVAAPDVLPECCCGAILECGLLNCFLACFFSFPSRVFRFLASVAGVPTNHLLTGGWSELHSIRLLYMTYTGVFLQQASVHPPLARCETGGIPGTQ